MPAHARHVHLQQARIRVALAQQLYKFRVVLDPLETMERVKAPVPGPSSITGPPLGARSWVMSRAKAAPDGATAPVFIGCLNQLLKNEV
jgi:hypothetical protein